MNRRARDRARWPSCASQYPLGWPTWPPTLAVLALALWVWSFIPCALAAPATADGALLRRCLVVIRAIAYDANLRSRARDGAIVIGVLRRQGGEDEAQPWYETLAALDKVRVQGLPVRARPIEYGPGLSLEKALEREPMTVVLLPPSTTAAEAASAHGAAVRRNLLIVATREEQLRAGAALAVVRDGDRLRLLVNARAAKAAGAAFADELLRIATPLDWQASP